MQDSQFRVWYLFLTQVVAVAGFLHWFGQFEALPQVDTASYRDYSFDSVTSALNDKRTFVYPSVLRFFAAADGSERLIPWFQYVVSATCTGFFLTTLLACRWNHWLAFAAASPLLASPLVLEYSRMLTPDLLAQSFSVVTVSCWLVVVHRGNGLRSLIGLSLFSFLTYQTKPSYLFLLAFVPVGGWIARWWLYPDDRDAWRVALQLTAASIVPFLSWCFLRWTLVGHFGLVSFGGYNIIGIAGQWIQNDSVNQLSADVQPLAEKILQRRELKKWEPTITYEEMETRFNPMVWDIAVPAAAELYDGDSRLMNRRMAELSSQVLKSKPMSYGNWLGKAAKRAVRNAIEITLRNPIVLVTLPMWLLAFAWNWQKKLDGHDCKNVRVYDREFQTIVWLSLGYAICKMALVILVEPPIDRYCAPATVFLASVLVMGACRAIVSKIGSR
jgi:hypothetical protein